MFHIAVTVADCLGDDREGWYREPTWITPYSTSKNGCIVSSTEFCGKLDGFKTKTECFKSNEDCYKQVDKCKKMDATSTSCSAMNDVCNLQFLFCATCGNSTTACEIQKFNVKNQA